MKKTLLILCICLPFLIYSQNINENFEKWPVIEKAINITGIDLSPDGKQVAMVCGKRQPLLLYDLASRSIVKEIDVKAEYLGYNVYYSSGGNYLLLQEKVIETSFKKAKKADYYVVDLKSGEVMHRFARINDAKITADEQQIVSLENGTVYFRDIQSGKVLRQFSPEDACNALALSPDGKELAVVIKPGKKEVMEVPSVRADKKAIKANVKLRHMIAIYDLESLEQKALIKELYDNINLMHYSNKGDKLLSFNVGPNSYINVVNMNSYEPLREAYLSKTTMQPEFEYSQNEELFAVATVDEWPAVNIYKVATGSITDSFDTKMKIWKNLKKKIYTGSNTSFVFLPDNRHVLIAYGNSLIKWRIEKH
jgi:WD40 repeat protein